jgi:hypothetical protein
VFYDCRGTQGREGGKGIGSQRNRRHRKVRFALPMASRTSLEPKMYHCGVIVGFIFSSVFAMVAVNCRLGILLPSTTVFRAARNSRWRAWFSWGSGLVERRVSFRAGPMDRYFADFSPLGSVVVYSWSMKRPAVVDWYFVFVLESRNILWSVDTLSHVIGSARLIWGRGP